MCDQKDRIMKNRIDTSMIEKLKILQNKKHIQYNHS